MCGGGGVSDASPDLHADTKACSECICCLQGADARVMVYPRFPCTVVEALQQRPHEATRATVHQGDGRLMLSHNVEPEI